MTTQELRDMMLNTAAHLTSHTEMLCKLDSFIGDGDHGITVERGFKAVEAALKDASFDLPADVLKTVGDSLVNAMGGAIGPILSSVFCGCVKKLGATPTMDVDEFDLFFTAGLRRVKLIGEAAEGDRTLVDALSPAAQAFSAAKAEGLSLKECMARAADAAEQGKENTKTMVAKRGRARFLGEKSLGYVDAGATTMSLIVRSMSDYLNQ